jgi:hypothetical protein
MPDGRPLPERARTYQGRPLPRPDEELVDQGLGFDVATLLTRRQALRAFGLGAAGYEQSVTNLSQVSLDADTVFGDDSGASQLGTVTGDVKAGLTVSLIVGIDTSTTPTGRVAHRAVPAKQLFR